MLVVTVPATLSNLGPGYDTLGLALSLLNRFEFEPGDDWRAEGATVDPDAHLTLRTARRAVEHFGGDLPGLHVRQQEHVPRSRGLGSSATARVAGLLAALELGGVRAPLDDQLTFLAAEEGHPDNVVPAMVGGLAVVDVREGGVAHLRLAPPKLHVAICVPDVEVPTDEARRLLPSSVSRDDAVFNLRRLGFLLVGLLEGVDGAVTSGLDDRMHQSCRAPLIGPVDQAFARAKASGALGAFISGSGSTLAAFCHGDELAAQVAEAMASAFEEQGLACKPMVLTPVARGALASH